MDSPDKRAVAPGKQSVQTDNIKDESWVIVDNRPPVIGRIFFATNKAELDFDDMKQIEKIVDPYQQKLKKDGFRGVNVYFDFLGTADYRYGDPHKAVEYNRKLSQERADAVASYLGQPERLGGFPNYVAKAQGLGIDWAGRDLPPNSAALSHFRRVDIFAPSIEKDPDPAPEVPGVKVSKKWKARIYNSVGIGIGVAAAETFFLEIVDVTNNMAMAFHYYGGGIGFSYKGIPGIALTTSGWCEFSTLLAYNIMDFEGDAYHLCAQAQVATGPSSDVVNLLGKARKRIEPKAVMWWEGYTVIDWNVGAGATMTKGMIVPTPAGQKPYWPPRIPL